jgi:hypothetical protein
MPLAFTCPYCEHTWVVDEQYVGQEGPCASCGKTITIAPADAKPTGAPGIEYGRNALAAIGLLLLTLLAIGGLIGATYGLIFLVAPSQVNQPTTGAGGCATNIARIGQAMLDYHAQNGHFPPAYTADAAGKPLHSWRVLLLPYLGHTSLYQQIDLTLPWDDPQHQFLLGQMPSVYACPDNRSVATSETTYVVVRGKGLVFDGPKGTSLKQITDGPAKTILVVETAAGSVNWMDPRDLNRQGMNLQINSGTPGEIGSFHATGGGAHAVMADGKVKLLSDLTQPQFLQGQLTIAAGDETGP